MSIVFHENFLEEVEQAINRYTLGNEKPLRKFIGKNRGYDDLILDKADYLALSSAIKTVDSYGIANLDQLYHSFLEKYGPSILLAVNQYTTTATFSFTCEVDELTLAASVVAQGLSPKGIASDSVSSGIDRLLPTLAICINKVLMDGEVVKLKENQQADLVNTLAPFHSIPILFF